MEFLSGFLVFALGVECLALVVLFGYYDNISY